MRQQLRCLFLAIAFFLSGPASLFALEIPKRPEGYVSDYAKLLPDSARSRLEHMLKDFEDKTGNQVLVATFPGLAGDSLESYSIRLAEAWKPGQKGKDNGVILLIFKEDRKVRIEVGYGLEGVLTDALGKLIIENEIVPRFRAGDYDGGIERGVTAILSATQGEYRAPRKVHRGADSRSIGSLIKVLFGLIFMGLRSGASSVILLLLMVVSVLFGAVAFALGWYPLSIVGFLLAGFLFYLMLTSGNASMTSSGYSWRSSGWGAGGFSGGGFGGGGFSGGGGGFGGGGASGSW